jgi:TrmH family RNA methyltransferase
MLSKSKAKYIQSLGQKKHRDEEGRFIAEGPKIVEELIQSVPGMIEEIYATQEWLETNQTTVGAIKADVVSEDELIRISQLKTPNKVIAVVRKLFVDETPVVNERLSLVLDTIQDPGNLGTIIRLADWYDISQIICSPDCADVYNPKVVQASMGSISRVHVIYEDLPDWLGRHNEIPVYAMVLNGKDIDEIGKLKEGLIVIGNESRGISDEVAGYASERITIGRKGKAESLNAAIATAIVLSKVR